MIADHDQAAKVNRDTLQRRPAVEDLRTAAFLTAINKVAGAYVELGIFP